jgi:hypothetical protein
MKEEELKNNYHVKRIMYVEYDNIYSIREKEKTNEVKNITLLPNSELKEIVFNDNTNYCVENMAFIWSYPNGVARMKYWLKKDNDINFNKNYVFFVELYNGDIECIGLRNGCSLIYKSVYEKCYIWESIGEPPTLFIKDFDCIQIQSRKEYNYNQAIETINSLKKDNIFNRKKNLIVKIDLYIKNSKYGKVIASDEKYYLVSLMDKIYGTESNFIDELIDVFKLNYQYWGVVNGEKTIKIKK